MMTRENSWRYWRRKAAVAGKFYPGQKRELLDAMQQMSDPKLIRKPRLALVVPHAGYIYSGRFAAAAFDRTEIPQSVIILCPNHTGRGPSVSIWSGGEWETPLGVVKVDTRLASALLNELGIAGDRSAHEAEHAIEVQLPFLQAVRTDVMIVPVVVGGLSYASCRQLSSALAHVMSRFAPNSILLIASSDMSHYVSAEEAKLKDKLALDPLQKLDSKALYSAVVKNDISMCGFVPATIVIDAVNKLGEAVDGAELVAYGHSGEVTGDTDSVVAYAAAVIG